MYEITYGPKYQQELDVVDIAKLMRKDIRDAIRSGKLPAGVEVRVRTQRYSGGQSIRMTVVGLPAGFRIYTNDWIGRYRQNLPGNVRKNSREAIRLIDTLRAIHNAYNYDGSESQADDFHVNYYGFPVFDRELERDNIEQHKEELP